MNDLSVHSMIRRTVTARLTACVCVLVASSCCFAQELDATVSIDARQLRSEDRVTFAAFPLQAQDYLNGFQWTGAEWPLPKVRLAVQISLTQSFGDGSYSAQILVVSQRATAQGDQSTPVLRVLDQSWQFEYSRGEPLIHRPGVFHSLTSMFDYFAYLALGCDVDSRADLGGTELFHRAYDICIQGQSSAKSAGWTLPTSGGYSRFAYVSELLEPRFAPLRRLVYSYHALWFDRLAAEPEAAAQALHGVVDSLLFFKSRLPGPSVALDRFLDAKYLELAQAFASDADKPTVYQELETIDPSHQSYYEEARNK